MNNYKKNKFSQATGIIDQFMKIFFLSLTVSLIPICLMAQDMVYTPVDPAFGGNPYNYSWLLSSANAQNHFQNNSSSSLYSSNPLDNFASSLQNEILSQLAQQIVLQKFGNLNLNQKGKYDLGNYIINIVPGLSGININVFDKNTGNQSTITIPKY